MKSVLIVVALVALAMIASPAAAYVGTILQIEPIFDGGSFQPVFVGWYSDYCGESSADRYDVTDIGSVMKALPDQMRLDLAPISGAPTNFGKTSGDFRAANDCIYDVHDKRWVITAQVENNPEHIGGPFGIQAAFVPGFGPRGQDFLIFEGSLSLAQCRANALTGNCVAHLSGFSGKSPWSSSPTRWTLPAPTSSSYYDSDNDIDVTAWGPNPTMNFTVYAALYVPEPSSIFALISGLVGLAGLGMRRRR